jgi:hypothetical protein
MPTPDDRECTVTVTHMVTILDSHTWVVGCEHRSLAVITESWPDHSVFVTLQLEDRDVDIEFARHMAPRILFQGPAVTRRG